MLKTLNSFSGVSVNDLHTAKEFYQSILGFTLEDESMGLRFALPGGGALFIYDKENHVPADYTALNLVVENIDSSVDELVANGVVFEHYDSLPAPQDERQVLRGKAAQMGPDIAWFKDPAGNILSLIEE